MSREDFNNQNEKSLEQQLEELQEQNLRLSTRISRLESIFQNTTMVFIRLLHQEKLPKQIHH
jgi:hypothetical protein